MMDVDKMTPNELRLDALGTLFYLRQWQHMELAKDSLPEGTRWRIHRQLRAVTYAIAAVETGPSLSAEEVRGSF